MAIFTIASIIALAASSIAASGTEPLSKRGLDTVAQPSPSDVQAAIDDWNTDVTNVNNFLNSVHDQLSDLPDLASNAQIIATTFAQDEPNQLQTLSNWFNKSAQPDFPSDAFNCAFDDLATGQLIGDTTFSFKALVIDVFANIVSDAQAGNGDAVQAQVDVVNSYRCCNVLPDLDILWQDAAISAGIAEADAPRSPARPNACGAIDCAHTAAHSTCSTLDNGRFGAIGS